MNKQPETGPEQFNFREGAIMAIRALENLSVGATTGEKLTAKALTYAILALAEQVEGLAFIVDNNGPRAHRE